ncbi:MAG: hypothetical protein IT462_07040 [Planctomycetes bacterium]|nr:hypothetical protein [Planctomycetota bacterium]
MLANLKLLLASLRHLTSRTRAKLARKLAALSRGATRLIAASLPARLGMRLCQVAVACALAAAVAANAGVVNAAGPSDYRVTNRSAFTQRNPAIASDLDGDSVVVWTSYDSQGWSTGAVFGRRYNSARQPQGPAFLVQAGVNTDLGSDPAVAMDADGGFVVVWTSNDASSLGVFAQVYNAQGRAIGGNIQVNQEESANQSEPTVAMDADGNFVVAWTSDYYESGSFSNYTYDIFARMFSADGAPLANEFRVNTTVTGGQQTPSAAMDANGGFVIAWEGLGNQAGNVDADGIFMQRYDALGATVGTETLVNEHNTNSQFNAAAAMDADGDFVVVWEGEGDNSGASSDTAGIWYRLYTNAGVTSGGDRRANDVGTFAQYLPAVDVDADGNFVVSWTDNNGFTSSTRDIDAREFNADGSPNGASLAVSNGLNSNSAVAMDADGDYVIVSSGYNYGSSYYSSYYSNSYNANDQVYAAADRFEGNGDTAAPMIAGVFAGDQYNEVISNGGVITDWGVDHLIVSFSREPESSLATDLGNWELTRNGEPVAIVHGQLAQPDQANRYAVYLELAEQLRDGDYVLTASENIADLDGDLLDGDFDGVAGGDYAFNFTVSARHGSQLNVTTGAGNNDQRPDVAMNADGDFVVVWLEDATPTDVVAQRYSAGGMPVGTPITVNTNTGSKFDPAVAIDADGNFAVTWEAFFNASNDFISARIFNADGTARTGQIAVGSTLNGIGRPDIAMDADGDIVVTWEEVTAGYWNAMFRLMESDGDFKRGEQIANDTLTFDQTNPSIAVDSDGDFVIAWEGFTNRNLTGYGVMVRAFDNAGRFTGGEFAVDCDVLAPSLQSWSVFDPSVAMDADGDFVVAWTRGVYAASVYYSYYDVNFEIRAARFHLDGQLKDPTDGFRVSGDGRFAEDPAIAMDEDGDFVVTFGLSFNYNYDDEIMARSFSANGLAQGAQVMVNSSANFEDYNPAIAMDADGEYVVVWQAALTSAAVSYNIDARVYLRNTGPATSTIADIVADENDAPVVVNLASAFNDNEDADAALAYEIINNTDPTVAVAGLDGAQLGVAFVPDSFGTTDITIRVTDTDGRWVEDTFTVTVNEVVDPVVPPPGDDEDEGCAASTTGAAPWGLLAVLFALFGGIGKLVRRKQ